MTEIADRVFDLLQLGGLGLLIWRGGRWTGRIDVKLTALCKRVRVIEDKIK